MQETHVQLSKAIGLRNMCWHQGRLFLANQDQLFCLNDEQTGIVPIGEIEQGCSAFFIVQDQLIACDGAGASYDVGADRLVRRHGETTLYNAINEKMTLHLLGEERSEIRQADNCVLVLDFQVLLYAADEEVCYVVDQRVWGEEILCAYAFSSGDLLWEMPVKVYSEAIACRKNRLTKLLCVVEDYLIGISYYGVVLFIDKKTGVLLDYLPNNFRWMKYDAQNQCGVTPLARFDFKQRIRIDRNLQVIHNHKISYIPDVSDFVFNDTQLFVQVYSLIDEQEVSIQLIDRPTGALLQAFPPNPAQKTFGALELSWHQQHLYIIEARGSLHRYRID